MKQVLYKYFVLLLIVLAACNDNDDCSCTGEIYGKWEAKEFMSLESMLYTKNNDYNPIIEFLTDGTFTTSLGVNTCLGNFELISESGINISNAACTKVCCDSDFSSKFIEILPQVESYEIEESQLKLNVSGWGWIVLEYVSD